jgi:hypothetical protein
MSVTRRGVRLSARIKGLFEGGAVKAGVLSGATYPADMLTDARTGKQVPDNRAGMPVATIARALEYGHGQNHPRPFIGKTVAEQGKQWAEVLVGSIKEGRSTTEALLVTGQVMKEDIQATIADWPADNAPSWAEFKGFNRGLDLTGHLLRSIESEVVGEGT